MAYIEFNNVTKEYKTGETSIKALDGASFSVEKGELAVILGSSGAGKTTALNILGGMDVPTAGGIKVDGRDIAKYNKKQLVGYRRTDIGREVHPCMKLHGFINRVNTHAVPRSSLFQILV